MRDALNKTEVLSSINYVEKGKEEKREVLE